MYHQGSEPWPDDSLKFAMLCLCGPQHDLETCSVITSNYTDMYLAYTSYLVLRLYVIFCVQELCNGR